MRLLSICPRLRKRDDCLVATTAWRAAVLTLGTVRREVVIDPDARTLRMDSRYVWLINRHREIPFDSIQAVTYGYEDMFSEQNYLSFGHDSFDWFKVGLRLRDDSEIHLFSFIGDGTFNNDGPWPDWMYWESYALDLSGSQDKESRTFVDVLAKMFDVSVVPPRLY